MTFCGASDVTPCVSRWGATVEGSSTPPARQTDGFVAVAGYDTVIKRANGPTVATLKGLRSVEVSWQPLCKPPSRTSP